jgi:DNA oxidative demethylase
VVLHGFATSEAPMVVKEAGRIAQTAPFRHLVTPCGYTIPVAMTNCGPRGSGL